ncbi:hypothetical protein BV25DRAFT_1913873 [Artomyces pyxidatus]|uniref:Uncharacterized protein n=1 Tax=Artomyces pyxidatus TaxID=48021 RepID=A0ACB8TAC6_9AGAM|nr:hypothetical protein BV25DRAFT_1913873 [Artomyces pyxidatus]
MEFDSAAHDSASESYSDYYDKLDEDELVAAADCAEATSGPGFSASHPPTSTDTSLQSDSSRSQVLGKRNEPSSPFKYERPSQRIRYEVDDTESFVLESLPDEIEKPVLIGYHKSITQMMDSRKIPWGIIWEISRLVASRRLPLEAITPEMLDIMGDIPMAKAGPLVEDFFLRGTRSFDDQKVSKETSAKAPWSELERELRAFVKHPEYGCLGVVGAPIDEDPAWYGGKVQFSIKVSWEDGNYKLGLEQPELGPSSRFTRRFGSDWLIRVRITKQVFKVTNVIDKLEQLFLRPFVIGGRVFRFFYANKERNVFLMATNERYLNGVIHADRMPRRVSVPTFLSWHNPMHINHKQTVAKWSSRIALGLSNSVPGILLEKERIAVVDDIISPAFSGKGKPPSEMEMTDGCGFINRIGLYALYERGLWADVPTAVQVRVCGAKGLLLLHPGVEENSDSKPLVVVRRSMDKIKYDNVSDPALRTIDVLRASHMRSPSNLSRETIINLWANGVPTSEFSKLLELSLEEVATSLTPKRGELEKLWNAVAREGSVFHARKAREAAGTARVRGLKAYDREEVDSDDEDEDNLAIVPTDSERSSAWWGDEISGCPSSLEETVMVFLDAGFSPFENPILAARLHEVVKKGITSRVSKCRINVAMSCTAHIVPDPFGVLEEGEIHVKASSRILQLPDGRYSDKVVGDVLVTRNPCKLPTDVQKVRAVFKGELDNYTDVIVFSVKGSRSLASMLGTGDYDGDKVLCIWHPSIVTPFRNAKPTFADPPLGLDDSFLEVNEMMHEIIVDIAEREAESSSASELSTTRLLQTALMKPLRDTSTVGVYSALHDNAVYTLGYSHTETVRLAWMFCTVLDGAKTGKTVKPDTYKADRQTYQVSRSPSWKLHESVRRDDEPVTRNEASLLRPRGFRTFVMDELQRDINLKHQAKLVEVEQFFKPLREQGVLDRDLVAPWKAAEERARNNGEGMQAELEQIVKHVKAVRKEHKSKMIPTRSKSVFHFTEMRIEARQDVLRALSRKFASEPSRGSLLYFSDEEMCRVRASYAYFHDWEEKKPTGTRFPWNVAMRELGLIKAAACGDWKAVSGSYYEKFSMRKIS